jgi:predicted N-acetyltransferase YhbS
VIVPDIVSLDTIDSDMREALLDAAFGPDRRGLTSYRLRGDTPPIAALSFAAVEGARLVGSLQSTPVMLHHVDGAMPLVLVGPVAIAPDRQGEGIGTSLLRRAITEARDPLVLIGDPEYYGRFGFTTDWTANWTLPGPVERRRLLARSAVPLPVGRLSAYG